MFLCDEPCRGLPFVMKVVCAWCGAQIEGPGDGVSSEVGTSHGMCSSCSAALASQERGTTLQQHLDAIPIPIVLLDSNNSIVTMNATAYDALGQRPETSDVPLLGKVFDCVHSRSRTGCGRMIHSVACAIRRNVTTTFKTGNPQVSVPATGTVMSSDDISDVVLHVTTVKMGGVVLLRLE